MSKVDKMNKVAWCHGSTHVLHQKTTPLPYQDIRNRNATPLLCQTCHIITFKEGLPHGQQSGTITRQGCHAVIRQTLSNGVQRSNGMREKQDIGETNTKMEPKGPKFYKVSTLLTKEDQ
jgi:hypothetical protein